MFAVGTVCEANSCSCGCLVFPDQRKRFVYIDYCLIPPDQGTKHQMHSARVSSCDHYTAKTEGSLSPNSRMGLDPVGQTDVS